MKLLKKALSMVNGFEPRIVLYLMLESPTLETSRSLSFTTMALRLTVQCTLQLKFIQVTGHDFKYNLSFLHKIIIKIAVITLPPLLHCLRNPLERLEGRIPGVVLVVQVVGNLHHVLHVVDQHLSEDYKVAVVRVLHFHGAPGIMTSSHHPPSHLHQSVSSTDIEELSLRAVRRLVDVDLRHAQFLQDPQLEVLHLSLGETVGLGDERDFFSLLLSRLQQISENQYGIRVEGFTGTVYYLMFL